MPDHAPHQVRRASSSASSPASSGMGEVPLGRFGSAHTQTLWEVVWDPAASAVAAWPAPSAKPASDNRRRILGRVPTIEYVQDTIDAISGAHGNDDWQATHGVEELSRWLCMVRIALEGEAWRWPAPMDDDLRAYYLDYGHTRGLVDRENLDLTACELWHDLDDLAAQACGVAQDVVANLGTDGALALAARAAQELVDVAIALHLALNDGYHAAHQRFPGPRRSSTRPPSPPLRLA
jgi:hypothetical protein